MHTRLIVTVLATLAFAACTADTPLPTQASLSDVLVPSGADTDFEGRLAEPPSPSDALPGSVVIKGAERGKGKPGIVTDSHDVDAKSGQDQPGSMGPARTGFVLKPGLPVTIAASGLIEWNANFGAVGPGGNGNEFCATNENANGDPLPVSCVAACPDLSLVAQVGDGPLQCVGTGATLEGSGELVFYVNDNHFTDNNGSWQVDVSYECFPGNGNGDRNHYHCGPPGRR